MIDIRKHFETGLGDKPVDYVKKSNFTTEVIEFVKTLHNVLPSIEKEYEDIAMRRETKDCKAFKEKMDALAWLTLAHDNLYYWYITQPSQVENK